jgi:hypothetical protein
MSITKLFVPSGTLLHENSGETLSPTQLGLFCVLAALLATFLGMILPSSKVDDFSVKTPAASALSNAMLDANATIVTPRSILVADTADLLTSNVEKNRQAANKFRTLKLVFASYANSIFYPTCHHPALLNIDPA